MDILRRHLEAHLCFDARRFYLLGIRVLIGMMFDKTCSCQMTRMIACILLRHHLVSTSIRTIRYDPSLTSSMFTPDYSKKTLISKLALRFDLVPVDVHHGQG